MAEIIGKAEEPLRIGATVWLKGIGLKMVVSLPEGSAHLPSGCVQCMWVNTSNELQKEDFLINLLDKDPLPYPHPPGPSPSPIRPLNLTPNQEYHQQSSHLRTERDPKTGILNVVETPPSRAQPLITPKG